VSYVEGPLNVGGILREAEQNALIHHLSDNPQPFHKRDIQRMKFHEKDEEYGESSGTMLKHDMKKTEISK